MESKNDKTVKIRAKIEANGSDDEPQAGIESNTCMFFAKRKNTANLPQNRPPREFDAAAGICYNASSARCAAGERRKAGALQGRARPCPCFGCIECPTTWNVRSVYDKIHRTSAAADPGHPGQVLRHPAHPVLPVTDPVCAFFHTEYRLCVRLPRRQPHADHPGGGPRGADGPLRHRGRRGRQRLLHRLQRQPRQPEHPAGGAHHRPRRRRGTRHQAGGRHGGRGIGRLRHRAGRARLHRAQLAHRRQRGRTHHGAPGGIPGHRDL